MHSQLWVVGEVEHHLDPRRELVGGTTGRFVGDAVQPPGQEVGLLPQHREEQFVLRREVAVEGPRGQSGALEDRGHRDGATVRLVQTAVGSVDDSLAIIDVRRIWLHDRRL